jgi:7,8-dihydroneopterin aldolase/epimerase/oxygenase
VTKTSSPFSRLSLHRIELSVHLGWPEEERATKQLVLLDLDIDFAKSPKACETDELNDTLCYADLITHLHYKLATTSFRLIEHLSYEIYQLIKPHLPKNARLRLHLTKYPPIPSLKGGVCFSYGEELTS